MRVLLDMDGVLADWHEAAMNIYDCTIDDYKSINPNRPWEYKLEDWLTAVTKPEKPISNEELWLQLCKDRRFWQNIPAFSWTRPLVNWLLQEDFEVWLVSFPGWDKRGVEGKLAWLTQHLPELDQHRTFFGRDKWLMANWQTVLIDDCDANIGQFIEHGGRGICFPQPWNNQHKFIGKRLKHIQDRLKHQRGEIELEKARVYGTGRRENSEEFEV